MRRLIESLLELARFDAGQETMRRSPCDLAEIAQACVAQLRPLAEARSVRLECELEPASLAADADRLAQVITNLLSNALHYTPAQGEVRIASRQDGDAVLLSIADTGPGIAPDDLPHIFERFYRADKARSRADGRSGLGLSICKSIVDAHGGTIEVASRIGAGTTFTVRLPA